MYHEFLLMASLDLLQEKCLHDILIMKANIVSFSKAVFKIPLKIEFILVY